LKASLIYLACLSVCGIAQANGEPPAPPPVKHPHAIYNLTQDLYVKPTLNSSLTSTNHVSAGAASNSSSSATSGDSNSGVNYDGGNSRTYVAPAPVYATPLPANLCPLGDSVAFSIGWNFFSYAKSSVRTEIECLEKVLAVLKPAPVVEIRTVEVPKIVEVQKIVEVERVVNVCPTPAPKKKVGKKPAQVCK
jgi:hypothetical protein